MDTWGYLLIAVACLVFFSGVEAAFSSMDKMRLELAKQSRWNSWVISLFLRHTASFHSSMLVGNYVVLIICVILSAVFLEQSIPEKFMPYPAFLLLLQVLVVWVAVLVFGELLPKTLFKINPDFVLCFFALPILLCYVFLCPIAKCLLGGARLLFWMTGVKMNKENTNKALGKVDLDQYVQNSLESVADEEDLDDDVKIFQNALDFSNIRIRDCIVPRTEVVAVDVTETLEELKSLFVESGLSKIIVYDGNIDNVIGYIHSSEMFRTSSDWRNCVKPIPIVPETMPAHKLMKLFMQQKKTIAVVVDEFGGTTGIVSLEDLVEEIFGEIEDEHDNSPYICKKVDEHEYLLSARLEIDKVNEAFDLALPESDDYMTIGGLILNHYQSFPKLHEEVTIGKFLFNIVKVTATKIELVRLKVLE